MGPNLILDKSAFQSLSKHEHLFLQKHFKTTNAPILVFEILGDLSKPGRKKPAPQEVADLAAKFGGSGGPYNERHWTLMVNELMGNQVPMTGQIIPDNARQAGRGMMIDISPLGHAVMRWAEGDFKPFEQQMSETWRNTSQALSFSGLEQVLREQHVLIPVVHTPAELHLVVDELADTAALQEVWLEWMLWQAPIPDVGRAEIRARYRTAGRPFLRQYAPYTRHCVKAMLALVAAVRHRLLKFEPTHVNDVVYLFYLPFCHAFASGDRVHRLIAPILIRDDQTFIERDALKADLKRLIAQWDGLDDAGRRRQDYALAAYPPPALDSVVTMAWEKIAKPWDRAQSLWTKLSEDEQKLAFEEASKLYADYRAAKEAAKQEKAREKARVAG